MRGIEGEKMGGIGLGIIVMIVCCIGWVYAVIENSRRKD
jgi:hypothetical protein